MARHVPSCFEISNLGSGLKKHRIDTERAMDEKGVDAKKDPVVSPSEVKQKVPSGSTQMERTKVWSVLVVGAGPAGLMLASNLARFGIDVKIIDDRAEKTLKGRADGLQPKTIETFRQLRLAEPLLKKGVKIFEIAFWSSTAEVDLHRTSRLTHYPDIVDTLDPYVLLLHQGMIEDVFLEDLETRGVTVDRSSKFIKCSGRDSSNVITTELVDGHTNEKKPSIHSKYVIGCDGARSNVRKSAGLEEWMGSKSDSAWGVIDGILETNFPDIWTKSIVHSATDGSMLFIPRERNLTRIYVEMHTSANSPVEHNTISLEAIKSKAQAILYPYALAWKSIEWYSMYTVRQRVASHFSNHSQGIYIVGDAAHTHSPKAAQGMNVSMHDSFNLAWKLNLVLRGIAQPTLLKTYEMERKDIADRLIQFDHEHTKAFLEGDPEALARNFIENIRFISGTGADYVSDGLNDLVIGFHDSIRGLLRPGCLLPTGVVTRFIDANPVDIQLDIPILGQFRIYFVINSVRDAMPFLEAISEFVLSDKSVLWQASKMAENSYEELPAKETEEDEYVQPRRYNFISKLFTPALVATIEREEVEIDYLPKLFRLSPWTFYIDEVQNNIGSCAGSCTMKWFEELPMDQIAIVNVRPDGYVGSAALFPVDHQIRAAKWLNHYYSRFLNV